MPKKSNGSWKKERTTGRKYSHSDEHPAPTAYTRQKYWVSDYVRQGRKIKGHWHRNPDYHK